MKPRRLPPFQSLVQSIIYQQLSGKAAATILGRFEGLFGNGFPTPEEVLAIPPERLRSAGLSRPKAGYVRGLAEHSVAGRLPTLKACDLVVEAMTENQALKNETFATLDRICPPHAILATNTSSCNVTALAAATKRPSQVVGLHFFNPVPLMKLVEVARTILTDEAVLKTATEWVRAVGKVPVQTKDATAFIVNRLLVPYLLDAIRTYEGGLASLEDIDQAMKLGCGYPMGPFTLLDLVGLDTTMYVAEVMFEEFRESRYAPPPLLKRMVLAGHLGRKAGRGFYTYDR